MADATISQVAQQITETLAVWNRNLSRHSDWLGGTASGGPNNDGRYPLLNATGAETLVMSPARMADYVSGPAAMAELAKITAELARDEAVVSATAADQSRVLSEAARGAAVDARNLAQEHRNHAGTHDANARYWAELAQSKGEGSSEDRAVVEQLAEEVADNAALAAQDASDAAASAALAATFEPALYDLKSDTLAASRLTGVIDIGRIPVLPSQLQFVSSGGLADLTAAQQDEIGLGSVVTTTNGFRYVYSGEGSKSVAASYTVLADITPEWDSVTNRPSYFPSNITNVAGLQSALDDKWGSGDFNPATKLDVTGNQRLTITAPEAIRMTAASSFLSWWNADQTTRSGYIQFALNSTDNRFIIANELAGGNIDLLPGAGGSVRMDSLTVNRWLSAANGAFAVTTSGNLTALSATSQTVNATGATSTTGGTLTGQLEHAGGHFFFRPINNSGSYDDGSYLRGYYRGATGNLVLTKVGGSGPPLGILLEGVGQVWHSGNLNPANYAAALHSHDWAQVTGKPAFLAKFTTSGQWTRHQTSGGYIDFGPVNTGYAHIYTDRPFFYFNKPLLVNGVAIPKITSGTAAPSGGADGDVHIVW